MRGIAIGADDRHCIRRAGLDGDDSVIVEVGDVESVVVHNSYAGIVPQRK